MNGVEIEITANFPGNRADQREVHIKILLTVRRIEFFRRMEKPVVQTNDGVFDRGVFGIAECTCIGHYFPPCGRYPVFYIAFDSG